MKIAVIGASGRIGGLVAAEAHARGHEVLGVAPGPSRINAVVAKRSGDLRKPETIVDAVRGMDAVAAAVSDRSDPKRTLIPFAARTLVDILPKANVRRLLWCGGGGTLESRPGLRYIDEPDFPSEYRAEALAQAEALDVFRSAPKSLEWTYVSPPPKLLLPGPKRGGYRVSAGNAPVVDSSGESRINDADYAAAIVDELERPQFTHQRFTVGYSP